MTLHLSQERWGRVCLHLVAALRSGHWGWHFTGIGREIECVWPETRGASAAASGWPESSNNGKAKPI